MKKMVALCLAALVSGTWFSGTAFAQEDPQAQEAPAQDPGAASFREKETEGRERLAEAEQQSQGVSQLGEIRLGRGSLYINGMFLTGARARGMNQEGWDKDGNWALEGINALWEENRADLYLSYTFMNYGAFLGLRAQNYGPNTFDYNTIIMPRYAFIWADFNKVKLSVGKLYDEILTIRDSRLWKSSGPGDSHRFTDDEAYSMRVEIKPVAGLNIGFQSFFPAFSGYLEGFRIDGRDSVSGYYTKGMDETEAWKELGIGAQYSNSLFDAQLGVRLDSEVDRFNKFDLGPQGKGTYLDEYFGKGSLFAYQTPAMMAVKGWPLGDWYGLPRYKHLDRIVTYTGTPPESSNYDDSKYEWLPYGDGHYAFFGFDFKGVPNLTAKAHGGLYNLGAFDEFGYGRFSEQIAYSNVIPKLSLGLTMQQEFYGSDVWVDDTSSTDYRENSPFFQFTPQVSWALISDPRMPMPILKGTVEVTYGVCADVLDAYIKVKPSLALALGTLMADLFYEMEYTGYQDSTGIKPLTRHTVGLALMLLF